MASNANQKTTVCSEGKFDGSVLFVPTTNGNSKIPAVGSPVVAGSIRPARQVYRTPQFEAEGIGYDYQSTALTLSGSIIGPAGDLTPENSQAVGVVQEGYVFNTTVPPGSTGTGATVRVVDRSNFQLISGGHGYSVGDLLTIVGVTIGGVTPAQVRVASVNNYNFVLKNSVQMPVRASVLVAANSMAAVPAGSYVKVSSMVNDVNYLTIARSDGTELNLGLESNPRARPNVYTYESGQGVVYELAFGPRLTSKLVSSSYNEIADPELVASLEGEHATKGAAYLASITVNGITLTDAEKNVSVASANYAQQVGNLKLARSEFEKIAKKYSISTDVHQWSSYEQPPGSTVPVVGPTEAVIGSSIPITQNTGVSANFVASSYTVNVGTNNTYSGANGTGMAFTLVTRATNTDDVVSAAVVNPGIGYVDGESITMTQADLRAITGIGTLTVTTPVVIQLTVENVSTQGNIPSTIGVIIWRARQSVGRETRNVKNAIASVKDAEETLRMVSKGINPSNAAAAKSMLDGVLEKLDKARNTFVQKERKTLVTEHEPYLEFNVNRANVLNPFVASVVREVGGTRIYLRAYDSADPHLASQSHPVNMGGVTQFQFDDSNVGFQQGPSGNGAGDYAKILSLSTRAISPRLSSVSEVYDVSVTPLPSIVVYSYGDTIIAADQSGKFLRRTTPAEPAWSEAMVGGQIYLNYNGAPDVVRTITGFTTVDGNPVFVLNTAIPGVPGNFVIAGYTIRFSNIVPTSGLKDAESGSVPVPVDFDVPNFTLTDRVTAAGTDPIREGIVIAGYPPDLTDTGRLVTDIVQLSCVIEDGEVDTEQYLKNPDGSIQLDNTGQPVPNPTYQQVLGLAVCKYRTVPWFKEGMYMRSVKPIAGAFPAGAQSFILGFGDDLIIPRFGPTVQTSTENFFGPAYVYLQRLGAFTSTSLDTNQLQTLPNGRALANTVSTGGISVVNGLWNLYPNANVYSNYHYFDFGPDTAENANQLKNAIFGTNKSDNEPKSTVLTLVPKTKGGLTINRRAPDQKPLSANQEAGATGCMGSVRGVTHIAIGNSSGKLTIHEGLASNSQQGTINGAAVDIVPLPNIINALAPPNICHPKPDEQNPPPPTPKCDFIPPPQQVSQSNYVVFRNAMRGTAAASSPLNVNNNDFAYILGNTSATGSAESSNQRGQLWRNPAGGSDPNSSAPLQTPVMYGGNRSKNGPFFETSITADFGANRQMAQSQIYPPVCSINLELHDAGTGYEVTTAPNSPLGTSGGTGSGLTIYITSITGNTGTGPVYSFTIGNCGDGRYQVNDIITVTGFGGDCRLIVTAVNLSPANSTAATSGVNAQVLAEWTPPVIPRETGTMTFTVISQATAVR